MTIQLHIFALALNLFFQVPLGQEVRTLEPSKAVERESAGGESHLFACRALRNSVRLIRPESRAGTRNQYQVT